MQQADAIIVGGGPCGLAAAIALQNIGLQPIVIEKGNIVNAIYHYPTHQTFFSTSERLAIGDVPFIIEGRKPKRNQALVYYREVVRLKNIQVNRFEKVQSVVKNNDLFTVTSDKEIYETPYVVIATGYYDHPNYLNIHGEQLPKVFHYFKEGHEFFDTDVLVIGGKNSAIDAALELNKAGARVTVAYRGSEYSPSIKPWVLPEFEGVVKTGEVDMLFNTNVLEIREHEVVLEVEGQEKIVKNDFVFAMTGYHPDHSFIKAMGVDIEEVTGRPYVTPETMETNVEGLFIAGVIAAGNNANEIFIENGRFHGECIARTIEQRKK
ncbi:MULTISPECIES: YpdA family putative bacillithiol disulfide reductase [Lysinibacillus]|uniref:YpdA family putative bacillithiol disulfide reductase n=1 Tax=Lysinibacillus TaxID=400634 RepID=UPI0021A8818F|nr:YpdA family putative bacillithiol disulfide reductase [Lysinibacillus capsici]MCT1539759.1 YpdA family putative bacillithiol disulfide reductase [Lysinibacillus capsici]MCT1570829.1 YpdA family putative bacillithiol disulfide reductase [Lysinibacillus capsici]MCT1648232.1 YpdA family putative bacillithiol disulfide reductase [Lysinibacillus capsici]MCT1726774.1 YpdA family putative bacillithiol disulfide reductase [Lysinibacillus capsici]MCT1783841.1 YpdA family putative bacillithiol disulf